MTSPAAAPEAADAALVQRCARGDEGALAELYDGTVARVYRLALGVTRSQRGAEQVVRHTYREVWQTAAGFERTQLSAGAWVVSIAHRHAVSRSASS